MLSPEQVVPFLLHDDPIVRQQALNYFRESYDFGPLTADDLWAGIDRWGTDESTLGFAYLLGRVPGTEASLRRLLEAVADGDTDDFKYQCQNAIRALDLDMLVAHREEILGSSHLSPKTRGLLERRLGLIDTPMLDAWDRLMRLGTEVEGKYAGDFNRDESDALIEAAARGGAAVCDKAVLELVEPFSWRSIFAVSALGKARYEPAIEPLISVLAVDTDLLREETARALACIGTPEVVERILNFYPGKPWHVRLYSHGPIAQIKHPESETALLKMLDVELAFVVAPDDDDEEGGPLTSEILADLTDLCSMAGLDETRRQTAEFPSDLELLGVCEGLVATAVMTGTPLPEADAWRELIAEREKRAKARKELLFSAMRERSAEKAREPVRLPPAKPVKTIRNSAPKVGRNDPCPCGSGKKFKKCCGK